MATITKTYEFVDATTAEAAEVNTNFDTIYNEFNGSIDNGNIKAAAAIAGSKVDLTSGTGAITMTGALGVTGAATISTTLGVTGVATFTATPKTDHIAENTTSHGVSIDNKLTVKSTVQTIVTATDGSTVTFDMSLGNIQQVTLAGNRTLALSNVSVGQCFIINLIQDGTGSRTTTFWSTIKWDNGTTPTLTTTASKTDTVGFICVSTGNYLGYIVGQNL